MSAPDNLASSIKERLPEDLVSFLQKAGEFAQERQKSIYLVGGTVRDIFLECPSLDIDLVVEGDAIKLAREMQPVWKATLTVHPRFRTATLSWEGRRIDLVTARAETYARPGVLPSVRPGTIRDDLARRDFTINAMAIALNPSRYGELLDPHGGFEDTRKKLIRVLHEKSFVDDATRIWRALRYEQRLDFSLEAGTLDLLKRDIAMLGTISGDRIRHELELVLKEEKPEKCLKRAGTLGVLARLHPSLKADDWLVESFERAREQCQPEAVNPALYLALLAFRLSPAETDEFIAYLRLPKNTARVLRDAAAIKKKMAELATPGLAPSEIHSLLQGFSLISLMAVSLAAGSNTAAEHIELYLSVLRYVRPAISGKELKELGVPAGVKIREYLQRLRDARLDGRVTTKLEEEGLVRDWLK